VAGNAGAATITASPAVAAGTAPGIYKLTAVSAGATAAFLLEDPEGVTLGEAITGTAATIGGIGPFTITDAGADPAIGDQFTITVTATPAATAGQIVAYDPDATNGAEIPIGVNFATITTGAAETGPAVYHARDCEVSAPELTWPTGIDADVKAAAIVALAGAGIIVR
ncbi:head decoration protein, partial [Zavarzinia sp.]|uniref:head decoration protein n=1 Tax=Zavarzinia sp. TaxID=2027920 RepID=UPI003BB52357